MRRHSPVFFVFSGKDEATGIALPGQCLEIKVSVKLRLHEEKEKPSSILAFWNPDLEPGSAKWLRGRDLNPRPLGCEDKF